MNGKIVKISYNDINGNQDDRHVVIYTCFTHLKYNNNYIIYSIKEEYDKNKLYYGTVHLKENSVVVFAIKDNDKIHIDNFFNQYINRQINNNEYKILDISKIEKAEVISMYSLDYNYLQELEELAIPKKEEVVQENVIKNKNMGLYIILVILILLLGGVTYIRINIDNIIKITPNLICNIKGFNDKNGVSYEEERKIIFNYDKTIKDIDVKQVYTYKEEEYLETKYEEYINKYFKNNYNYEYNDQEYKLVVYSKETTLIENFTNMKENLIKKGYTCIEEKR